MPQVVIGQRYSRESLYPLDHYLLTLIAARSEPNPATLAAAASLAPFIRDPRLERELVGYVEQALAEHVEGGTIQVATIAVTGGAMSGVPVRDVATKLLDLALLHGTEAAAQMFISAVSHLTLSFQRCTLLEGIAVEQEIEVFDGVRLVPLPEFGPLPLGLLPTLALEQSEQQFRGAVLLIEDWSIQPSFIKPSVFLARADTPDAGLDDPFDRRIASNDINSFDNPDFARAMSLAVRRRVYGSMHWTHVPPDQIANLQSLGNSGYSMYYGWWPRPSPTSVTVEQVEIAKALYEHIVSLSQDQRDKMIVPINRIAESFGRTEITDRAIDLAIALECIFLDGVREELQFRLAVRAARFLADDLSERQEIVKVIKGFYRLRSQAAHTGRTATGDETHRLLDRTTELCCLAVNKILTDGQPDWDQIDIG